jgi:hypothetical protein
MAMTIMTLGNFDASLARPVSSTITPLKPRAYENVIRRRRTFSDDVSTLCFAPRYSQMPRGGETIPG